MQIAAAFLGGPGAVGVAEPIERDPRHVRYLGAHDVTPARGRYNPTLPHHQGRLQPDGSAEAHQ
eukprot:859842-Pyramimonas_sp.AAC.1